MDGPMEANYSSHLPAFGGLLQVMRVLSCCLCASKAERRQLKAPKAPARYGSVRMVEVSVMTELSMSE